MADEGVRQVGTGILNTRTVENEETRRANEPKRRLLDYGRAGFRILLADEVDRTHAPFLTIPESDAVWKRLHGKPGGDYRPGRDVIVMERNGAYWFIGPAGPDVPATVAELEERAAKRAEAVEAQAAERDERRKALRRHPPSRVVVLGDSSPGVVGALTLRGVAEKLENLGAVIEVLASVVYVRASVMSEAVNPLADAVYRASAVVVATAKREGIVPPERLPDAQVTAAGGLVPNDLEGKP